MLTRIIVKTAAAGEIYTCVCMCVCVRERRMATSAKPIVIIDNIKDPFATVVSIQFGDYLEGLIDTVRRIVPRLEALRHVT